MIVSGLLQKYQADLLSVINIKKFNDGNCFILTCIDVFSKFAYAIPLKNKTASSVLAAFRIIFKKQVPRYLQTDAGTEFWNRPMKSYLKEKGVHHFSTFSELKASILKRFNRTLKEKNVEVFYKQQHIALRRCLGAIGLFL